MCPFDETTIEMPRRVPTRRHRGDAPREGRHSRREDRQCTSREPIGRGRRDSRKLGGGPGSRCIASMSPPRMPKPPRTDDRQDSDFIAPSSPESVTRVHAPVEDAADVLRGDGPAPVLLGHGIEPRRARPGAQQPLEPHPPRLVVPVLDAAAGLLQLVGAHRRVAHEDQLVVVAVLAHHVDRRDALAVAAVVVLPHRLVDAVVEVVVLEVLELGARGAEELLHHQDVVVHRAAHVEEEQHLHGVVQLAGRSSGPASRRCARSSGWCRAGPAPPGRPCARSGAAAAAPA